MHQATRDYSCYRNCVTSTRELQIIIFLFSVSAMDGLNIYIYIPQETEFEWYRSGDKTETPSTLGFDHVRHTELGADECHTSTVNFVETKNYLPFAVCHEPNHFKLQQRIGWLALSGLHQRQWIYNGIQLTNWSKQMRKKNRSYIKHSHKICFSTWAFVLNIHNGISWNFFCVCVCGGEKPLEITYATGWRGAANSLNSTKK